MTRGPGRVILLNGPSSSGKTTIARAIQRRSQDPWLRLGIDVFWSAIDERWMEFGARADEGFRWAKAAGAVRIVPGPVGQRLAAGMRAGIAAAAREGNDVIADDVLIDPAWLEDWIERLDGLRAVLVALHCPADVLAERERERRNRVLGEAVSQVDVVHAGVRYDLELDTAQTAPEACADTILSAVASVPDGPLARWRAG